VTPEVQIETVTISPYFALQGVKIALEILFVCILLHLLYTEFKEIRARKAQRKAALIWAGGGKNVESTWTQALVEHFWSGEDSMSNVIDAATIGLGIWLCVTWLQVTFAMSEAEYALKHLHRPTGVVAYDDTDYDVWSVYHHEVTRTEHKVEGVIYKMVRLGSSLNSFIFPFVSSVES
jgi:hypothetical protein